MKKITHQLRLLSGILASAVLAGAVCPALPAVPYTAYAVESDVDTAEVGSEDEDFDEEIIQKPQYEVTLHNVIFTGMDVWPDNIDPSEDFPFEADAIYLTDNLYYYSHNHEIQIIPGICFDDKLSERRQDAYTMLSEFSKNNYVDITFITDQDFSGIEDQKEILNSLTRVAAVKCVKIPGSHLIGDVNDDGVIDTFDMVLLREALNTGVDEKLSTEQKKCADIDNDGSITESDLSELSAYLLGAEDRFNTPSDIGSIRLDDKVQIKAESGTKPSEQFAASQMNLGIKMLQQLKSDETTNKDKMLISPLSASAALTMTANGADSNTLAEMEKVLGNDLSLEELNEYFAYFIQNLPSSKKETVNIANSIWFRDADWFNVHDSFLEKNKKYFSSEIYKSVYDETTVDDINSWVNQHTNGMIPKLLDNRNMFDDPNACMTLVNTLYFEADWASKYNSDGYATFTTEDGTERSIRGLYSNSNNYYELDNAIAFKRNYAGNYKFVGILPDEGMSLDEYIASIDPGKLSEQLRTPGDMDNVVVHTMIPKLDYQYSCSMKDTLKAIGMGDAFDKEKADFTNIADVDGGYPIYIDDVIQKTNIELSEKGTKAAAATAVITAVASGIDPNPPRDIYIFLERPFVYMIVDENDIPAFIGCISDLGK